MSAVAGAVWREGAGFRLSGPEAAWSAQHGLRVAADARLDEPEALAARLGLDHNAPAAALIAAAYRTWGPECATRLEGDFAFAVWDPGAERLVCARDRFGVKPLYLRRTDDGLAFASTLAPLLQIAPRPAPDPARLADFLAGLPPPAAASLYAEIERLPPASRLTFQAGEARIEPYWRLTPPGQPRGGDEAVEAFQALLRQAVRRRAPADQRWGVMLSGGLDSSAIAGFAADLPRAADAPIPALSIVFDRTPQWNERPYIEAVLARGGFDPVFIAGDDIAPFEMLDAVLAEQEGPFLAPNLATSRRLYQAAAERGLTAVLDGHGGDEVVSHGQGRLHELAAAGAWGALWQAAKAMGGIYGETPVRIFLAFLDYYGPGKALRRRIRRKLRALRADGNAPDQRTGALRFIRPEVAERTGLASRIAAATAPAPIAEAERHLRVLTGDQQSYAFEVLRHTAATFGIEPRYPFWDKDLVELCLGLEARAKLDRGWSRLILRRAMEGAAPPQVQWRRDKLDFTPHLIRGMTGRDRGLIDAALSDNTHPIAAIADLAAVREAWGRITMAQTGAHGADVQAVWRTLVLARWLTLSAKEAPAS